MSNTDPVTGATLPADAIQRVLFVAPAVHVYNIPPLSSTKGFQASSWTANNNERHIFTARLRILETAIPIAGAKSTEPEERLSTTVLLEDPSTAELFAAAPYNQPAAVQQATDSSRFFAVRVVGEGGRKATLGIGFEERSDAFDFGVALQDARRVLEMESEGAGGATPGTGRRGTVAGPGGAPATAEKKDFSLKEGETIRVAIGGKGQRGSGAGAETRVGEGDSKDIAKALFSIRPPPGAGGGEGESGGSMPFLPPPPGASEETHRRGRRDGSAVQKQQVDEHGFGDDDFGDFAG